MAIKMKFTMAPLLILHLFMAFSIACPRIPEKMRRAVAVFNDRPHTGRVFFTQKGNEIEVDGFIEGFTPDSKHGIHIHTYGDIRSACKATGSHYDKYSNAHGGLDSEERHFGDMGNVVSDNKGKVKFNIRLPGYLFKSDMIFGRSLVIHERKDDLGKNNNAASHANGNTGPPIACAVIGIRNFSFAPEVD